MALPEDFSAAAARSRDLAQRPSNEDLLELYSLYKQGSEGDNTGERPGGFDFKAIAKHDAWAAKKGLSREQAMKDYIALVDRLAAG